MIESDTIKLLRECDAGVKMGVSSIDDVLGDVKNEKFRQTLYDCRQEHYKLDFQINKMLYKGEEKTALHTLDHETVICSNAFLNT